MTLWLKNARIYDGTGAAPFLGEVLVKDDRIAAVGETVDGSGRVCRALDRRSGGHAATFCTRESAARITE